MVPTLEVCYHGREFIITQAQDRFVWWECDTPAVAYYAPSETLAFHAMAALVERTR